MFTTCLLTTFSTVERLSGTVVVLSKYLLSCPVYTTRPRQQPNNRKLTQNIKTACHTIETIYNMEQ